MRGTKPCRIQSFSQNNLRAGSGPFAQGWASRPARDGRSPGSRLSAAIGADRKPVALIVPADLPRLPGCIDEKVDDS